MCTVFSKTLRVGYGHRQMQCMVLLTFEHQGCVAFRALTVDRNLTDAQLRHLIGEASQILQDRRMESGADLVAAH
jgi:hypothetical protein